MPCSRAAARRRAWRWPGRCSTSMPPRPWRPGSSSSACSPSGFDPDLARYRPSLGGLPAGRVARPTCRRCWRRSSRPGRSCSGASTWRRAARRPWSRCARTCSSTAARKPQLRKVDDDFAHLFGSWFNRGFLVLRPIDWSSPADMLERIIRYEAVHEIQGWDDLRRRVQPSRPSLLRLLPSVPDRRAADLRRGGADPRDPRPRSRRCWPRSATILPAKEATTAVFYSISNCQQGLRGVSFGNFLIKQVVEELSRELPWLQTFVTLSPAPGFAGWLDRAQADPRQPASPGSTSAAAGQDAGLAGCGGGRAPEPLLLDLRQPTICRAKGQRRQAGRPGGPLPSRQRRPARAAQLAGRHLAQGPARGAWPDGQLSLRSALHRGQPRGLRQRRHGRRLRRPSCSHLPAIQPAPETVA